jgi:hypothetical protein
MKFTRRTNLLWGVVLLAVAVILLLRALALLPEGVYDIIARGWPLLLVLAGLSILLRDRVPVGSLIALVLCAVLAGGVVSYAFSNRAGQQREDYRETILQAVDEGVTLLRIRVETLATDVELRGSTSENREVSGEFVGSSESQVSVVYTQDDEQSATFTIRETQPNQFPMLEAIGRGRLSLELPPEIPIDVQFIGEEGAASLNMDGLDLERLNVDVKQGDVLITLPAHDPLYSEDSDSLGTLEAEAGDMTIFVPDEVAARLELQAAGGAPQYDSSIYNLLAGGAGILEARSFDIAEVKLRYTLNVPRGQVRLEVAP